MSSSKVEHKTNEKDKDKEKMSPKKRSRKHEDSDESDSRSSSYSSSSSSEKHKKHKKKKEKKEKKGSEKKKSEKKEKKHKKHKHKHKSKILVDNPISEDDYYIRSAEFRTWLKREKGVLLGEIKTDTGREYFKKFVSKWNQGKLPESYYSGVSNFEPETRTNFQWKIKRDLSELDRGSLIDEIERDTNTSEKSNAFRPPKVEGEKKKPSSSEHKSTTHLSNPLFVEEMDDEDRVRYEKTLQRKKDRDIQKTKEAVLEELVPKETGREAVIEKRKQQREWNRKGDDSPEMGEDFGDDTGFKLALARERQMKARKTEKQELERQKRVEEYRRKEEEKMAPLRALAARFQQPPQNQ